MRTPKRLMKHTITHYTPTYSTSAGERVATWTVANRNVPCNVQDPQSELVETYNQRNERLKQVVYLLDGAVYAAVDIDDRITFNGDNYRVIGKQDMCNLERVYVIFLAEAI